VTELSKLPGIGSRTAQRLAFHILRSSGEDATALAEAIREVKERIGLCEVCFNLTDEPRCRICQDARRDHSLICVVEEPSDVIPMERTHEYQGVYHVLGGALSPIDGIDPEDLKIAELFARAAGGERHSRTDDVAVREVVLATNPTTTGEATALHLAEELRARSPQVTVTRLASGLPVGSDLEYADEVTLGKAFAGRRSM
jgi:recombination protein RecR